MYYYLVREINVQMRRLVKFRSFDEFNYTIGTSEISRVNLKWIRQTTSALRQS